MKRITELEQVRIIGENEENDKNVNIKIPRGCYTIEDIKNEIVNYLNAVNEKE